MIEDRIALSDWLLGAAIRFEYGDNGKFSSFGRMEIMISS